jgi:hypothetical protein
MNTELKITTDNKINEIDYSYFCKYYLPCGKCDKNGELCQNAVPQYPTYPSYPHYPWEYVPYWWTSPTCKTTTSNTYTFTTGTETTNEPPLTDNKTTMTKPE